MKRAGDRIRELLAKARTFIHAVAGVKEIRVCRSLRPQEEKISHALAALLTASVAEGSRLDEYRTALDFVVLAWNISLLSADERSDALNDLALPREGDDAAVQREVRDQIEGFLARKQAMFPHDKRFVVAAKVRFRGDYLHVSGAALISPPQSNVTLTSRAIAHARASLGTKP